VKARRRPSERALARPAPPPEAKWATAAAANLIVLDTIGKPTKTMPAPLLERIVRTRKPDATGHRAPRAKQIAEGLVRTGRASDARLFRAWLQLRATAGNFYWIALDGSALLRGATFDGAEELQQRFADAMARAGATR
jgi:hypothetical protein